MRRQHREGRGAAAAGRRRRDNVTSPGERAPTTSSRLDLSIARNGATHPRGAETIFSRASLGTENVPQGKRRFVVSATFVVSVADESVGVWLSFPGRGRAQPRHHAREGPAPTRRGKTEAKQVQHCNVARNILKCIFGNRPRPTFSVPTPRDLEEKKKEV